MLRAQKYGMTVPEDLNAGVFETEANDILILGSDGVFDNIWKDEIIMNIEECKQEMEFAV